MSAPTIKVGLVVCYHPGLVGIVTGTHDAPDQQWIDEQINAAEIKKLGQFDWWGVQLFSGGFLCAPGPLLKVDREATYDDFLEAVDKANEHARRNLATVFPEFVKQVMLQRKT